jgi:PAS domain S-box-containing protein
MVVDEAPDSLAVLRTTLEKESWEALPTASRDKVLVTVQAKRPDIILLDIDGDRGSGLRICEQLKGKDETRSIPIILISALGTPDDRAEGFRFGATDYLIKPYKSDELLGRVRSQFALRKAAIEEMDVLARQRQLALSSAGLGWWHYNMVDKRLSCDERSREAFGLTGACAHKDPLDLVHPEDLPKLMAVVSKAFSPEGSRTYSTQHRICLQDGSVRWVESHGMTEFDEAEHPITICGTIADITERKQAEEALRRWADAFEHCAHGISMHSPATSCVLTCNPAMARLLGSTTEEVAGKPVLDFYTPECREHVKNSLAEADRVGKVSYEAVLTRRNGVSFPVQMDVVTVRDEAGNLLYRVSTAQDIAERKQAEKTLLQRVELQDQLAKVAATVPGMVYSFRMRPDGSYCMPFCTAVIKDIWGVNPEEVRDNFTVGVASIHPEDRSRVLESIVSSARTLSPWRQTFRLLHRKKGEVWVEGHSVPRLEADGSVLWHGFVQDVTEKRKAEATLQQTEARYRLLAENVEDFISVLDPHENRRYVSPSFFRATGWTADEVMRSPWDQRLHPEDLPLISRSRQENLHGHSTMIEHRILCKNGSWMWVEARCKPVLGSDGRVLELLNWQHDITARKRAEDEVKQQASLINSLLDSIPDLVFYKDLNGVYLGCNPAFTHFVGRSKEQIVGMKDHELFSKELADSFRFHDQQMLSLLAPHQNEEWVLYPDGRRVLLDTLKTPYWGPDGKLVGVLGISRDITARKEADQALRESEERFRGTLENLLEGCQIVGFDWRYRYVNRAAAQHIRTPADSVVGRKLTELHPGIENTPAFKAFQRCMEDRLPTQIEAELAMPDGSKAQFHFLVEPVADGIFILSLDITQRKRLECARQAVLALGARLNSTRDPLGAGRALLDAADQLWTWDSATLHVYGADDRQVHSILLVDTIDGVRQELPVTGPREPTERMRRIAQHGALLILREDTVPRETDSTVFGDTTKLSASIMCVPIRREVRVIGFLSIQSYAHNAYSREDLDTLQALADYCGGALDRIRSEEALHQSEERYRSLVETTFDWIWEVDAQGHYTYASPRVRDLLGYTPEEVLGRSPFDLMPATEAQRVRSAFEEAAAKRQAFSALENLNRHKDGRLVVMESSAVPVLGPEGKLVGYRGMDRDVTERKRLEAELRQAQKLEAIGQLAGGVAHDFNNILAAMMMHLGLLQMNPNLDEEMSTGLAELDAQARRAASLTRQLLMFSRRSVLTVKTLNLNEVVSELLKMLTRLIGEHIELRFEACADLPPLTADAGMLEQVLMNLLVNARDAMPKGGRITISTSLSRLEKEHTDEKGDRRHGDFLCLSVADTGSGMDAETLKRIFEPFFTTKGIGRGTGLGLATVHGIAAQHKGWVEVESEQGRGSVFRVFLPALPATHKLESEQPKAEPVQGGKETILLAEDDEQVRRWISKSLRALGYRVLEARTGQEAVSVWQTHNAMVDLLLTDMVMPEGMTGLELAEKLQAAKPDLRIIISSGYSAEIVQAGVPTKAGVKYLPKPYETKVLAKMVRESLDQPGHD